MIVKPLVSIITIVYNGEKYIADTIRSVAGQTWPNLEYIIVDGGSTDNTLTIIRESGAAVTLISEKDSGISDAFNKGIRMARGSIIGLINADDWYAPEAVEAAVSAMEGYDIAYGDLQRWKEDCPTDIIRGDHYRLHQEMSVPHPTVFVRRECYDRYGLFDERYQCAMDYDLVLRLATSGCRFVHIPAILANMRWGGMSDAHWHLGCLESMRIKDNYLPGRKLRHRLYYLRHVMAIRTSGLLRAARIR